jgi:hypothetical protein
MNVREQFKKDVFQIFNTLIQGMPIVSLNDSEKIEKLQNMAIEFTISLNKKLKEGEGGGF